MEENVKIEPDETAERIRDYLRDHPELRKDQYDGRDNTVEGLCYVAAEVYFHATGGTDSDLDIYCLSWSDVDPSYTGTHWYLRKSDCGTWIDLGVEDIRDTEPIPFESGTRRAFITGYEPSKRSIQVLEAIDELPDPETIRD